MSGFHVSGLQAGYRTQRVIQGLDLEEVPPGTLVALVGANAAGKSTLLRTLAGLLPAQGGGASLGGESLFGMEAGRRRRLLGYLPQSLPAAGSLYAWEMMRAALHAVRPELSRSEVDTRCEALFVRLGLQALAMRRMSELSGGQRQMVGLAQLIVREPALLLLDEPTSALDPRWQIEVLDVVRNLAAQRSAIALIALHDLNLALRFCDRIVVLAQGKVLAQGLPAQAMNAQVLQAAYGVRGRVEQCTRGATVVHVDEVLRKEDVAE